MRCRILLAFLILALGAPHAFCEDRLLGRWKSSLPLTRDFYQKHAILTEPQREFVEQLFGELVLEYRVDSMISSSPDKTVTINGKTFEWHGANSTDPYEVLFSNATQVALKQRLPDGTWGALVLNFVDADTYWVYVGDQIVAPELNIREYFVRLK